MRSVAWLGLLPLVSCMQLGTGTGARSDGGAVATADGGKVDAGPGGAGCFQDPTSQTILCQQIDTCPGVTVDEGAYPDCGFRMQTGALDFECICADSVCPIGVPTSCDQARQLLQGQSALVVCQQQAEGRCVPLKSSDAGSGGGSSTCDKACEGQCGGDPSCMQACGC